VVVLNAIVSSAIAAVMSVFIVVLLRVCVAIEIRF
jgi:hypothetical protein